MKATDFVRSLLPTFKRNTVLDELNQLRDELTDTTLQPYKDACELLAGATFNNYFPKATERAFEAALRGKMPRGESYLDTTYRALRNLQTTIPLLIDAVEDDFGSDIAADGLTYRNATVLQLTGSLRFFLRYARSLLLVTLAAETSALGNNFDPRKQFTAAEIKWLENNRQQYFDVLSIFADDSRRVATLLEGVPELIITPESYDNARAMVGATKLDPFNLGLVADSVSFIFRIPGMIASAQVDRYNLSREELKSLELRLLRLKDQRSGVDGNARLEQEIEYTDGRVQKLRAKIAKWEADHVKS